MNKVYLIIHKDELTLSMMEQSTFKNSTPVEILTDEEQSTGYYIISTREGLNPAFAGYIKFTKEEVKIAADRIKTHKVFINKVRQSIQVDPWRAKILSDGRRIFRRKHGKRATVAANSEKSIRMVVPYNTCKIDKVEITGCHLEDNADLKVLDSDSGLYTGTPNALLNQFGFDVALGHLFYSDYSEYDAELRDSMIVELIYKNKDDIDKEIGVNFTLHELK